MKKIIFTLLVSAFVISACQQNGGDFSNAKSDLKNESDSISFMLGYNMGGSFKKDGFVMNNLAFAMGYNQGYAKDTSMASPKITEQYFRELSMKMQAKAQKEIQEKGEKNLIEGPKYLEANKKKEGVVELPSGLQYRVLKSGKGARTDSASIVEAHYTGRFIDGEEFESSYSYGSPIKVPIVGGVIPGWTEALLLMREGDKWELTIPANLAYGEQGQPPAIPPHSVLVFDLELISITTKDRPFDPNAQQ